MADVSLRQQSLVAPNYLVDSNRLATSLYECCLQVFLCFVKGPVPGLDSSFQRRLHTQAQKFKLWGASFDACEGELDQKLVGADRLKNALLPILSGMGETLVTLACRLNRADELADTFSQFQLLKVQVAEVTKQSCLNDDDIFAQISLDELSSLESGDSSVDEMAELEDLLRDTQSYNACLFGLSSVLEDSAEKAVPGFDDSQSLEASNREPLESSAWPYIASIIEAYPSIDRTFARRLGGANEIRYARLQGRRDRARGPTDTDSDYSAEKIVRENQPSKSQGRVSYGSTSPSTKLSSIPDSTSSNPAQNPKARAVTSLTTFASSELEENTQRRSRGIPKLSEDEPWGTPFSCTVCGDYLENIWSCGQWVIHVYEDLQPYICSFADCSLGIETFVSRHEWGAHEFTEHREKQPKDLIRISQDTCPFCQTLQAGPRSQYISHVGRHMQDISHAAIPISAMTDGYEGYVLSEEEDNMIHDSIAPAEIADPEPFFISPAGFRPTSLCVGREKEIERLDQLFLDERWESNWGGTSWVWLHGMPGVGKTHLAREYAFANRDNFKGGVFWIPAQSRELIFLNLIRLMQRLAIRNASGNPIESVYTWLRSRENWLLVFDGLSVEEDGDIEELAVMTPNSKDSGIICIARAENFSAPGHRIRIGPLGKEASRCLLFKELNLERVNERQRAKATEIIESVGSLPLAIVATARHLAHTHQSLEDYTLSVSVSHLTLGGTFQEILDNLVRAGHTEAWNLLRIMCWFAPRLPVKLLMFGLKDQRNFSVNAFDHGRGAGGAVSDVTNTFAQLFRYALIEEYKPGDTTDEDSDVNAPMDPEPIDTIAMHKAVQSFCCDALNNTNQLAEWLEHAVQVFCSSYRCAYGKMKQRSDIPCVYDYIHYLTHGQQLWERCSFYDTKDRSLGHLKERLKPVIESIEQEIGRQKLAEAQPALSLQTSIFESISDLDSDSPYYDPAGFKLMSW